MDKPSLKTALPGPKAKAIIERDGKVVSPSYTRGYPFVMARGSGAMVEDVDGNTFLDCAAGIAVNSTGHSHPDVVAAIVDQAQKFLHMSGTDFYYEPQVKLGEEFDSIKPFSGPSRSFFSNSGTEAIEAAIKLARYSTRRYGIIAFLGSFHGRTLGALALTSSKAIQRKGFGPMQAGTFHTPYGNCYRCPVGLKPESCQAECLDFLEHQILVHLISPDEVAGVVVEPIQGEGGYVVPEPKFHQRLRDLTKAHGILLIADEVMCGMGRTGTLHAVEQEGITPDLMAIAKGLGGGYQPVGAVLVHQRIIAALAAGSGFFQHGHTYLGHPVGCAAALAVQKIIHRDRLLDAVVSQGAGLFDRLHSAFDAHPHVGDIRGRGLFLAIELVADRATKRPFDPALRLHARIKAEAMARGLMVYPMGGTVEGKAGDHVLLAPPFIVTDGELDAIVERLGGAVDAAVATTQ